MNTPQKYTLVGTGSRAEMFIQALATTYRDSALLVGLCDLSQTRMNWYNQQLEEQYHYPPCPTYHDFARMIQEQQPHTVIVTTPDYTHHQFISQAMEMGCDVITEKPMTIDTEKTKLIFDTIEKTGKKLTVTFNYRYAPAYTHLRKAIMEGKIGQPLAVDFSWMLDTRHGADYFRRWHREKEHSGGLLVHKATHHFDLVNWWIDSYPQDVFAMGGLQFYGSQNAAKRGEKYAYSRYTGSESAKNDPFALFLDEDKKLRQLYLEAEADSGYIRDRNVFGDPITIEDTMVVTVRYQNGVILAYSLIAYSPWEGMRVAITGTKGRIELEVIESTEWLGVSNGASKGSFKTSRIRVFPHFANSYEIPIPQGEGGHGGADPVLLEQLFSPTPPPDPFHRAASHMDGAASILTGIAANHSMETGQMIRLGDLFGLPARGEAGGHSR